MHVYMTFIRINVIYNKRPAEGIQSFNKRAEILPLYTLYYSPGLGNNPILL